MFEFGGGKLAGQVVRRRNGNEMNILLRSDWEGGIMALGSVSRIWIEERMLF